jgi:secreted trypsin-like serine protease
MLKILVLVLCVVFTAHGRPGGRSFQPVLHQNGPNPVIVGGSNANYGDFPYVVSIQYDSATTGWGHFCAGILYKNRYVISTAHCIDNKQVNNVRVVVGAILLQGDANAQIVAVSNYTTHPGYEVVTGLPNDLAILKLANTVATGGTAQNAVLPPDDSNLFLQTTCYFCGWGQTSPTDSTLPQNLQQIQLPTISNAQCADELTGFDNAAIFDTHICTLSPNRDAGPCDADAGSPLTCCRSETDCGVKYVSGLLSYFITISGECSVRDPSVHVRLSKFLAWIESNTP